MPTHSSVAPLSSTAQTHHHIYTAAKASSLLVPQSRLIQRGDKKPEEPTASHGAIQLVVITSSLTRAHFHVCNLFSSF